MLLKVASKRNIEVLVVQTTKIHHKLGRIEGLAKGGRRAAHPRLMLVRIVSTHLEDEHLSRNNIHFFHSLILMLLWFQVLASLRLQISFHCNHILPTW